MAGKKSHLPRHRQVKIGRGGTERSRRAWKDQKTSELGKRSLGHLGFPHPSELKAITATEARGKWPLHRSLLEGKPLLSEAGAKPFPHLYEGRKGLSRSGPGPTRLWPHPVGKPALGWGKNPPRYPVPAWEILKYPSTTTWHRKVFRPSPRGGTHREWVQGLSPSAPLAQGLALLGQSNGLIAARMVAKQGQDYGLAILATRLAGLPRHVPPLVCLAKADLQHCPLIARARWFGTNKGQATGFAGV
ncbi:hypothetical protein H6P81_016052 [Aristolochia fimbriata]|uniref:Ribosomal protein L2 n=1 Tax=Aristolochia fimbriata TaxID=158543 RepID=A0AAV7E790_ARIFI|nr:hypothetical protein H6P81_016052 [Aristolochia fimbriata]